MKLNASGAAVAAYRPEPEDDGTILWVPVVLITLMVPDVYYTAPMSRQRAFALYRDLQAALGIDQDQPTPSAAPTPFREEDSDGERN